MSSLSINKLHLKNYRCFAEISVSFHEKMTVLIAPNGSGKTSILDAIAVAFGPFIGAFSEGVGTHFLPSDIRLIRARDTKTNEMEYVATGIFLEAEGYIPGSKTDFSFMDGDEARHIPSVWKRTLAGPTKAKTTTKDAKELTDFGKRLQEEIRTPGNNTLLPLVAYYGTGRLWQQKKLTLSKKLTRTSRTTGYLDCLDPASSYKTFVEWFRYWNLNAQESRIKSHEQGKTPTPTEFDGFIESVSRAVNICLLPAGWKNIRYSFSLDSIVAEHSEFGELPVELLSDGIRNMVGMVADIAFRSTKLNSQLGKEASLKTNGIVLIDEVDMHLHPAWQQVVLSSLTDAFPNIQFIVTTHSPQVLSTVKRENIRVIGSDIAEPPLAKTYGEPSGEVMHSVMSVDPQPPVKEKADLLRLTEWVDQGHYAEPESQALMQQLVAVLGEQHPQLQRLQRSIARQEALKP